MPPSRRGHTNRQPFSHCLVPPGVLADLVRAAASEGATFHLPGYLETSRLLCLISDAERDLLADPGYRVELAHWVGGNRDRDGISSSALGPRDPAVRRVLKRYRVSIRALGCPPAGQTRQPIRLAVYKPIGRVKLQVGCGTSGHRRRGPSLRRSATQAIPDPFRFQERSSLEEHVKAVAVFPGSREVKVVEQEGPRISRPDQVRLRMLDIGICGTDREICSFEYGTPPPGDDYLVIGHESVAEIVQVGPAVERFQVGDLIVPSVRRPCFHPGCLACRSGHQDYCYTGDFSERGIKEAHGYMTEYVVDHEQYLNLVPPDLREIAVLTEPLTIAEKALAQIFWMMQRRPPWIDPGIPSEKRGQGLSALVLGIGPVGLLGAMTLVTAGFTTYVYSREMPPNPRIDLVAAIGATYVSSQTATFAYLTEQMGNIDLVYEAVGHSHFALEALRALGTNGILVLTGVPGLQAFIEADPARLMRDMVLKNQVLLGTVNAGPDAFAAALRSLHVFQRRWPAAVRTLIAGRYPPEQALDLILGRPAGIKSVIAFDTPA
jgi:glucose 1-dehydrogenase